MLEHDYLLSSKDFGYRIEIYEAWETYRRIFPNKDSTTFCKNWKIAREELPKIVREIGDYKARKGGGLKMY